jgi:hypothetical protein
MQKKIFSALLIVIISFVSCLNSVFAQTAEEYLKEMRPFYLGILIGKMDGCKDINNCSKERYQGSIEVLNGKLTLAKEILINSDEKLANELGDTGLPSDKIDFDFETELYKGLIVKIYLDEEFTLEDSLTLNVKRGAEGEKTWVIPYDLLTKKTLNVLYTSAEVDDKYADWREDSEWVKVMPLYYGSDNVRVPNEFAKRLEVLSKLNTLENFSRAEYLAGRLDHIHYLELQKIWSFFWGGTRITSEEVSIFSKRYSRLRKMINENSTSLARLIGNLRLYTNIIEAKYDTVWYNLE